MTPRMTLPDLLTEAARLMPERFERDQKGDRYLYLSGERHMSAAYRVTEGRNWSYLNVCEAGTDREGHWLLREGAEREIMERGWGCYTSIESGGQAGANVYSPNDDIGFPTLAPTPAEALLTALIQAVEGERV